MLPDEGRMQTGIACKRLHYFIPFRPRQPISLECGRDVAGRHEFFHLFQQQVKRPGLVFRRKHAVVIRGARVR